MRSAIEAKSRETQETTSKSLIEFLCARAGDGWAKPSQVRVEQDVVEAWELQRRVTVFHTTWRAPFLPHDGQKHRLLGGKAKEPCARAERPPLGPPGGRSEPCIGWKVVSAPEGGPCDPDGWQYGFDFYEGPSYWGPEQRFAHVRRRLWRWIANEQETRCGLPLVSLPPRMLDRRPAAAAALRRCCWPSPRWRWRFWRLCYW
ncbi:unnamed protein product [Prorocentrum cordatum]|uniref:Peroxin/Ferlin domain-containing protein n=1 Tax=Prorocentrum cordatum TaxID=2364126 RepID=A0ABN9YDW5_9DINO|nr:unnamed protein product [Polarella glacialis]